MADPSPNVSSDEYEQLSSLWHEHQSANWLVSGDAHEGELMTLDTVVGGCVIYYFEEGEVDAQRVGILDDCLGDLESLISDLEPEAQEYFMRLQQLGALVLKLGRKSKKL